MIDTEKRLYTLIDVYNELKMERDVARTILELDARNQREFHKAVLTPAVLDTIALQERFLTRTMRAIDLGLDRETEE